MKLKKMLLVLLILPFVFVLSCDSSSDTEESTTSTTETSTSSSTDYLYSLTSDELDEYLENLEVTDEAIASAIVIPAVVEITVYFEYSYTTTYFSPFGGSQTQTSTGSASSSATGFFINEDGYFMTNAHVITLSDYEDYSDFEYTSVEVYFNFCDSDDIYTATIVEYDSDLDLAVLVSDDEIEDLSYLTFFDIDYDNGVELYYGESVIAVGNANGYGISVTSGVVSAPLRYFEDGSTIIEAIQTDAAINEGNSGGPLTNLYGAVVGINSFKVITDTSESLGYAIPSNVVIDYLESIDIDYSSTTERAY